MNLRLGHGEIEGLGCGTRDDLDLASASDVGAIGEGLHFAADRRVRNHGIVDANTHGRFELGRVVDHVVDQQRLVLLHLSLAEAGNDNRAVRHRISRNELIVKLIGAHRLTIDDCLEVSSQGMTAVGLLRNGVALLAAGNRSGMKKAPRRTLKSTIGCGYAGMTRFSNFL